MGSIVMLWMQGKFYRHKTEFHPHTNMYVCCDFCVGWVGASCAGMHVSAAVSCEHLCVYVCGRLWAFVDVCRRLCTYACTFVHVCVYVCARLCTFVHGFVRLRVCLCAGVCLRMLVSAHMCARVCTASVPWTAQGQGRLEHDDSHLCPGPLHAEHLYDVCGHRVDQRREPVGEGSQPRGCGKLPGQGVCFCAGGVWVNVRVCVAVCGCVWLCVAVCGCVWLCVTVCDCV